MCASDYVIIPLEAADGALEPAETLLSLDRCLSLPAIFFNLGAFLPDLATNPALLPRDTQWQTVTIKG
jgi:hypothetical protein